VIYLKLWWKKWSHHKEISDETDRKINIERNKRTSGLCFEWSAGFYTIYQGKEAKKNGDDIFKSNLDFELSQLDKKELSHLEEEFKDYKELYPREK
jgi:hypothetical protein